MSITPARGRDARLVGPILVGAVLGVASALEEAASGFDIGISSDGLWLAVAFFWGTTTSSWRFALVGGAAVLTTANLAYYAAGGGAPGAATWFALGIAGGAYFGAAGRAFRVGSAPLRLAAILSLAGVLIAEGSEAFRTEGEVDDGIEFAIGCILPVALTRDARYRIVAAVATAAIAALAVAGVLEPLVP